MGILACPNCSGKLRVPDDGATRKVKCPSCGHVFSTGESSSGSVSKATPKSPPKTASGGPKSGATGARSGATPKPEYEIIDEVPEEDEEEEERPRSKAGKPKNVKSALNSMGSKSSRRSRDDDDDDDDDDDRPRRRSKNRGSRQATGDLSKVGTGLFLHSIGFFLLAASIGIGLFLYLLNWIGAGISLPFLVALPAAGAWCCMTVGLFMLVTAPKYENAQSYAITTVLIGVLHLFCLLYVVQQSWGPSVRLPPGFEHLRDDFDSVGGGGIPWHEFNSRIPGSAITMSGFIHSGRLPRGTIGWIHFMLPLLELARWVFLLLTLRAVARIARDYDSERTATMLMFVVPGLVFGSAIMFIIIGEIGRAAGAGSGFHYVFHVLILAMTAGVAGVCALTGIACKSTKDAIG